MLCWNCTGVCQWKMDVTLRLGHWELAQLVVSSDAQLTFGLKLRMRAPGKRVGEDGGALPMSKLRCRESK